MSVSKVSGGAASEGLAVQYDELLWNVEGFSEVVETRGGVQKRGLVAWVAFAEAVPTIVIRKNVDIELARDLSSVVQE